jgi:hypothetical protein
MPSDSQVHIETSQALAIAEMEMRFNENYSTLLRQFIFTAEPPIIDRKTAKSYMKLLYTQDAHHVMAIIWKESLPDNELHSIGMRRLHFKTLTAHGLAVMLSNDPIDLAKNNSKIRSITIAAAAYGLITRVREFSRLTTLKSTPLLHSLFIALAARNMTILRALRLH